MPSVFPESITSLAEADLPFAGVTAYISQAAEHQILFMEFDQDTRLPEHRHEAQVGFVLEGRIELTIAGQTHLYVKGDRYFIPRDVPHSGQVFAGYADITFFAEAARYRPKSGVAQGEAPLAE